MINEVVIIGGSYAGLSAALQLGRARRRVVVVDAGLRRNRFAANSHGFLGQDGRAPGDIAAFGRAELARYATVEFVEGEVVRAGGGFNDFTVDLADGTRHRARRLILAAGMTDILPQIPGLAERWGRSVFICPYCDGYELEQAPIGVIATGPHSFHHAMMLPDWGPTTYFTNGAHAPDAAERAELERRNVTVEPTPVTAIEGERADVVLADGRRLGFRGLFTAGRIAMSSPVAGELGCELQDGPLGRFVKIGPRGDTSVAGVFACGDIARGAGSVALAVGDGNIAGSAAHASLIFDATLGKAA
ncbi:thioredoxin reductase [Hoeflea marina]|uniref:Thioredoxin reductase n=1 Tax=Hoeflea marina TaxID=274592 RepID=A0A317PNP8_9HYPH|nr:NAD(P)/FAD-dependent oxidoreductase [Hoeflea marina]PWW01849.1 thioredoxin reductase [Hoeflea marina]